MKPGLRWSKTLALCVAVVALTGCRVLTKGQYDRLHENQELARHYEKVNLALTKDIDSLSEDKNRALQTVENMKDQLSDCRESLQSAERKIADQAELAAAAVESAQVLSRQLDDLRERNKKMADQLATRSTDVGGGVETIYGAEGYGYRLPGAMLFDSGKAELKTTAKSTLDKVVAELKKTDERIRVAGYTDSDPITASGWDSNFHLSGARALAVLNYLAEEGIPKQRMHFAGFGEYALIKGPDGKEDKEKSRRAEIWLLTASPTVEGATDR